MGRTFKDSPYRPYNKEAKEARKRTNRRVRKHNRQILHSTCPVDTYIGDDWDNMILEPPPHTEGWETH